MGDDGVLSQADIDALLNGGGFGGGVTSAPTFNAAGIQGAAELLVDQVSTVLGTLINHPILTQIIQIESAERDGVFEGFEADTIALTAGFEQGFSGELSILARKDLVALLSETMVGGDGTAPFNEEHIDAFKELGNQILGSASTALGGKYEVPLSTTQAKIIPFDLHSPPFSLTGSVVIEFKLYMDEQEKGILRLLLSQPLTMALTENFEEEDSQSSNNASQSGGRSSTAGGLESVPRNGSFDRTLSMSSGNFASSNVDLLLDIPLNVTIELGRTRLSIRKILELGPGSIIELDRLAGEPVDLLVNDKVVARGEVVVVDEYFGVRILSLISPEERIKQLR